MSVTTNAPRTSVGDIIAYRPYGEPERIIRVTALLEIKPGKPGFDGVILDTGESVWGYDTQITRTGGREIYACGYCDGVAVCRSGRMVHADDGDRVAVTSPGDYVSGRHNRAGSEVLPCDLVTYPAFPASGRTS